MTEPEKIRTLLATLADPPGELTGAPLARVLTIAHGIRRRRRIRSVVVAAVLVVAVAVPVAVFGTHASQPRPPLAPVPAPTAYPSTGPGTVAALATGDWSSLPAAPIAPRSADATVWTGRELIRWGGIDSKDGRLLGDGAAYDAATNRWQLLPPSPLGPRDDTASVWTGTAMFIWGGTTFAADGARYDPRTHQWRRLPPAPLPARVGAHAVWTGREVLVLGGTFAIPGPTTSPAGGFPESSDGAAYDPATNRWRSLPSLPIRPGYELYRLDAFAAGDAVYALATSRHMGQRGSAGVIQFAQDVWRCTDSCAQWLPEPSNVRLAGSRGPLWTGQEIVVPAGSAFLGVPVPAPVGTHGWRMRPGAGGWREMAHGPIDDSPHVSVWTGGALVGVDTQGRAAAWDPVADRWTRLPDAPRRVDNGATIVWTGSQILILDPHGNMLRFGG
ncbi:MAG: hypothetical protein J2P15_18245 [Micromonosporaceae bacterium]|nr:hypothetical protein [Micromonosporaceae bacterium]